MTIIEAQELVAAWTEKNGARHNELTNMAVLTEEIGKLAMVMARSYGDRSQDGNFRSEVSAEMGDILWALVNMANQTGVDLTSAMAEALARKSTEAKNG